MKTIFLFCLLWISPQLISQSDVYKDKMSAALKSYGECESSEDYLTTAFQFQQIAGVETKNWLPEYYYAMCYTMANYGVKSDNPEQKDTYLDEAEASIERLKKLAPNESEVFALEALFFTARLGVNPMERGQKFLY